MSQYQNQPLNDGPHSRRGAAKPPIAVRVRPHPHRRHDWLDGDRDGTAPVPAPGQGSAAAAGSTAHGVPRRLARVGILGATTLGMGIAAHLLDADVPVTVYDPSRESLDRATASLRSACHEACAAGDLTAARRDRRIALLAGTVNLHHLKDCDVIVEVMHAGMDETGRLVRRLNEIAMPEAILMACVATGDIDHIASLAKYPQNVLGFHLSQGAGGAQVWEFVPAKATAEGTLAAATALVEELCRAPEGAGMRDRA